MELSTHILRKVNVSVKCLDYSQLTFACHDVSSDTALQKYENKTQSLAY